MSARTVRVEALGAGTSLQDRGRRGVAHLGVPRSGALDAGAAALANRLVGNDPDAALFETTLGGLVLVCGQAVTVALTGAPGDLLVDGRPREQGVAHTVAAGSRLTVPPPRAGVRGYLALGGGVDVPAVLGSRAQDSLAGVGPAALRVGDVLPLGPVGAVPVLDPVPPRRTPPVPVLRLDPGPRADWFTPEALGLLGSVPWRVGAASNRVGLRLEGPRLARQPDAPAELPSEPMVLGAVQVPPSGPVVFLADHPVTGGYPVIGVVRAEDLDVLAQLRPGEAVRFTRS